MAAEGWNNPSSASQDSSGDKSWSNITNIFISDNNYSLVDLGANKISNFLAGTDFGFAIPTNAIIDGVEVRIELSGLFQIGATCDILDVALIYNLSVIGNIKNVNTQIDGIDRFYKFGSATDLWGASLTPTIVNDTSFGSTFNMKSFNAGSRAQCDNLQIKIYYHIPEPIKFGVSIKVFN